MAETNYLLELQKLTNKMLKNFDFKGFFTGIMTTYGLAQTYAKDAWENKPTANCANSNGHLDFEALDPKLERPDIGIKNRVLFRFVKNDEDVHDQLNAAIESACFKNEKLKIPVVIAASPNYICLYNAIYGEFSSFELYRLPENYVSLQPLTSTYRKPIKLANSTDADEKTCKNLIRLMDLIEQSNNTGRIKEHDLNEFMRRLVFCLFAEDTGLFAQKLFTTSLNKMIGSKGEGSERVFSDLFLVLNTPEEQRGDLKVNQELLKFPYVGGTLFAGDCFIPKLNLLTRNILIDCGCIKWREISPAIFGSLFQSAMDSDKRRQFGAHYTSEANILKLIKPLFLDELTQQVKAFEADFQMLNATEAQRTEQVRKDRATVRGVKSSFDIKFDDLKQRLESFHEHLSQIRIMDPACGCGNFLVVSYRELRKLENRILHLLYPAGALLQSIVSKVSIEQFYGIEIEDWPTEIAQLSMWLMQHQLNQETQKEFGVAPASLPLTASAHIVCANALTTDWNEVLPAAECSYLIGNPPFAGTQTTSNEQKDWLRAVYPEKYPLAGVDFVSGWFVKATNYMQQNQKCRTAFVSTNSICQGEQVDVLWGLLLRQGVFINFAYTTFVWSNEATNKAAVFCIIVGLSCQDLRPALIFKEQEDGSIEVQKCDLISPYLISEQSRTVIKKATYQLGAMHSMISGNKPADNGNLILSVNQGNLLFKENHPAHTFLKLFMGSSELCNNTWRYCLWLKDDNRSEWQQIPIIQERLQNISSFRANSKRAATKAKALTPWVMEGNINPNLALVIPVVSSENRSYFPIGIIDNNVVVSNLAFLIPNPDMFDYAILASKIHNVWMRFTGGKLKSDYRYSKDLTYNTFVWPELNDQRKLELSVLGARLFDFCSDSSLSLGKLNHPDFMPIELKLLHDQLDALVESYYRAQPFEDDDERLAFLVGLYNEKVKEQEASGKTKKSKKAATPEPEPFVWNGANSGTDITPWLTPLNALHIMVLGSTADDNGLLKPSQDELLYLLSKYPFTKRYIHRLISSESFYGEQPQYCLWLHDAEGEEQASTPQKGKGKSNGDDKSAEADTTPPEVKINYWYQIPLIKSKVEQCKAFRMEANHNSLAYRSRFKGFSFSNITYPPLAQSKLMLPKIIRSDYGYIPIWFGSQPYVVDDSVCIVPTNKIIDYALLNSRMHWVWMCATSEFDEKNNIYVYSIENTYNNLIWPHVPDDLRLELTEAANEVLKLTNFYADRHGQAWRFDIEGAGAEHADALAHLNSVVDRCYRKEPFANDAERLEFLKQLYLKYKF